MRAVCYYYDTLLTTFAVQLQYTCSTCLMCHCVRRRLGDASYIKRYIELQVLYLDVAEGDAKQALLRLGAAVIKHFSNAAGGTLAIDEGGRGFTPHVTVAKTSRLIGKRRKGECGGGVA